jgi:high-affinity nickel-transport protein
VLSAIALGFALGLRHAVDPDHVAAIAALVAREARGGARGGGARAAARLGAVWGLGHSLVILAAGGAFVALRIAVVPGWALAAEAAVAAILMALGVSNLRGLRAAAGHDHPHAPPARSGGARATTLRALGVGMAHGLAGSAAVALLALAAMPSPGAALAYLLVFGLGTVGGMVAMSLGLGLPASLASGRPGLARWVLGGSGAVSIAVGLLLLFEVGVALQATA